MSVKAFRIRVSKSITLFGLESCHSENYIAFLQAIGENLTVDLVYRLSYRVFIGPPQFKHFRFCCGCQAHIRILATSTEVASDSCIRNVEIINIWLL